MRSLVALFLSLVVGLFAFTAGTALMGSWFGAALLAAAVTGVVGLLAYNRPPIALDEAACSRGLKIVSGVAASLALVGLTRLTVFMVDPSQVGYSAVPTSRFEVQHSCVSAYFVSAQAASSTSNIYADSLFTARDDDPAKIRKPLAIGPFKVDPSDDLRRVEGHSRNGRVRLGEAASITPTPRTLWTVLVVWAALNIYWPIDWGVDPRLLAVVSGVPQALTIAIAVYVLRLPDRLSKHPA